MAKSSYRLADGVFWCVSDRRMVFMDLRRNKYLCLTRESTRAAVCLLTSSIPSEMGCLRGFEDRLQHTGEALVAGGLLTKDAIIRQAGNSVHVQKAGKTFIPMQRCREPAMRMGHGATFLKAAVKASWKLRCNSMHRTVTGVRKRKQRRSRSDALEHGELRDLVAKFHRMRPFYGRKSVCLFDSLFLVEFLACYRIHPDWVFGVTAEPFTAHCWVQASDCVLNDTVERVASYTPILVV